MDLQDQKTGQLQAALDYAETRLPTEEWTGFRRFFAAFYLRVDPTDVLDIAIENLYGAAMAAWKFAQQRRAGDARVRVYNPKVQEHGWKSSHTIIEIVNDDMPFLVNSITGHLVNLQANVNLVIHPVLAVERDDAGHLIAVHGLVNGHAVTDGPCAAQNRILNESVMHIQIAEHSDRSHLRKIRDSVLDVLGDVRAAVGDWQLMLGRLDALLLEMENPSNNQPTNGYDTADIAETKAFAAWMRDNHYTFLGCRDYAVESCDDDVGNDGRGGERYRIVSDSGLGILRDKNRAVLSGDRSGEVLAPIIRAFLDSSELFFVTKTSARGTVHRAIHMDSIGFKRFDEAGNLVGERRFVGLFTSAAYNRSPTEIPFLRHKVRQVIERSGLNATSHDGKALLNVLETYPRDELFQVDLDTITTTAMGIVALQERPKIRLFVRADQFRRFYSCLVFVPREQWSTWLRRRFENILVSAFNGRVSNYYTQIGDSPLARLHFVIGIDPSAEPSDPDYEAIERSLVTAARSWQDDLLAALIDSSGEETGYRLAQRYQNAFNTAYTEIFNADQALGDIAAIEGMNAAAEIGFNLYRTLEDPPHKVRFKVYHSSAPLALSNCLPMIEHMGLTVLDETPHMVRRRDRAPISIQDFYLELPDGAELDLDSVKSKFEDAFAKVWQGMVEDDGFNQLVIAAGLHWRDVTILRAYCKYLRQTGIPFSQSYMEDTLAGNVAVTGKLVALFHTRFDIAFSGEDRLKQQDKLVAEIETALDEVMSLDEDRILRRYLNAIQATLRTNFFQPQQDGNPKPYIAFKIDSRAVDELPLPRPFREIFIYCPEVEAIHLRGGKVARGGLRWSDRREDFRTEILGLMKAQTVKNAVIVPVGSKGGFVSKRLPLGGDREQIQAEVIRCYRIFIQGMLDITDNMVALNVVPPEHVLRYDDDDPYLVVAADKGTATFSDIANEVALENGFWLGDAFASGGATGYDHKRMGITARGAWESVRRHFRELHRDIQSETFTAIGIGDMSGDVFGNGMLLSRCCQLRAAFDHRHIFIDPDPDAESSYAERQRLFDLPRSSWADYDTTLISEGGGVYARSMKSITLSPQICTWLGLEQKRITPSDLIHRLLQAEIDLLWIGGIGTYVKAKEETQSDVGDRANDLLRVNGDDLRCRVVGEGGNLGFTQRGRIEAARNGVRLNTDAVDNAGGVDCSDHEVNIKILLNAIVDDGELTKKQRNRLLADMTENVSDLVLQNNYIQSQALSIMEKRAALQLDQHQGYMQLLEREGRLDRRLEALPDDEQLAELAAKNAGLSRPELSVLQAYAKMDLFTKLLESDLVETRHLVQDLIKYFPRLLRRTYSEQILRHRLRNEIVATMTANSIINRAGITFVYQLQKETGQSANAIARAYAAARDTFELRSIWNQIELLDNKVSPDVQLDMHLATAELVRRVTEWFLRAMPDGISVKRVLERYRPGLRGLAENIADMVGELDAKRLKKRMKHLTDHSVPEPLAKQIAVLEPLAAGCDIVDVAIDSSKPVEEVGRVYFDLGALLGLDWLREEAERLETETRWERAAVEAILEDLFSQQRALAYFVVSGVGDNSCQFAVEEWARLHQRDIRRGADMIFEFQNSGGVDIAKLAVANRNVRRIIVG